jgi:predicted nucleic acid-binding protein
MTLVDTSIIVAVQDQHHPAHALCLAALDDWAGRDALAVSVVTLAELAAGGRTREAMAEDFFLWTILPVDAEAALRAGEAFARSYDARRVAPLPDFFIRAQAAILGLKHLTNDRRRLTHFPEVDFAFP